MTLDEFIDKKINEITRYMLLKVIKPDITLEKVTQLDEEKIDQLISKYGIQGIILDVDKTLRNNYKEIPNCNKEWINGLKAKAKIVVLSNGLDKKVEQYFKEQGIEYISLAFKPLKKNFKKACNKMQVSPNNVLMIGDSLFSDIYGGKRNNMKTVLVNEVEEER